MVKLHFFRIIPIENLIKKSHISKRISYRIVLKEIIIIGALGIVLNGLFVIVGFLIIQRKIVNMLIEKAC